MHRFKACFASCYIISHKQHPSPALISKIFCKYIHHDDLTYIHFLPDPCPELPIALCLLYILSRLYIVVEAFISLRHVPIGVYAAVPWVQAIPHV